MSSSASAIETSSAPLGELAAVIVLHNSADVVADCLAALAPELEVIVVDNASRDDGLGRVIAARPDARILRSERNLGFGGGANLGWRATRRPYVAFLNPDVRVIADALGVLLNQLVAGQHIMVGPALLDRSGTARRCKRRPSVFLDVCGLLPAAGRWAPVGWDGKLDRADRVHLVGGSVPAIEGACFVMRRADLEAIGGFDEDFFLYYEEDSLALRLARLGGGAVYEPRAIAEHPGGASTATVSALAIRQFHRSRVIFYRKRDGELRGVLTGLALVVAVLVSMPGALLNTMLARKRRTTFGDLWHALVGLVAGLTARLGSGVCY